MRLTLGHLNMAGRNASDEDTKQKVHTIVDLYKERKIAQVATAEHMINELLSNYTGKEQKVVGKTY